MKIKLNGTFKDVVKSSKGDVVISFTISNYSQQQLLDKLIEDKYSITIEKYKDDRTLEQNRLLWKLISIIDETINGVASPESEMSIYISALLRAGAKYSHIVCEKRIEQELREKFRAVQFVHNYEMDDRYGVYRVYYGSSKMDKKEFAQLVNAVKQLGYECGVEMTYWEEVLDVKSK